MSISRKARIGFDRTIRLEWLDTAAARVLRGDSPEQIRQFLWGFLEDVEPGTSTSSGRGKTLTVLTRIWVSVPPRAEPLREAALQCIRSAQGEERVAIHWAMVAGTHPFFLDVSTHVGKLIKLNGAANRSQIKRRMTEAWGDRSTLERTIQHVLKSLAQWGLLRAGSEHGSLIGLKPRIRLGDDVSQLIAHSVLLAQETGSSLPQLADHAALFPFQLQLSARALMRTARFRLQREGDQSDFVELA